MAGADSGRPHDAEDHVAVEVQRDPSGDRIALRLGFEKYDFEDDVDVSRGDMLVRPHNVPTVAQEIDAQICWMDESAPLAKGGKYAIKHTTRWARASVRASSAA